MHHHLRDAATTHDEQGQQRETTRVHGVALCVPSVDAVGVLRRPEAEADAERHADHDHADADAEPDRQPLLALAMQLELEVVVEVAQRGGLCPQMLRVDQALRFLEAADAFFDLRARRRVGLGAKISAELLGGFVRPAGKLERHAHVVEEARRARQKIRSAELLLSLFIAAAFECVLSRRVQRARPFFTIARVGT